MSSMDSVTVKTFLAIDQITAFKRFTEEIDTWWKRGPKFRYDPTRNSVIRFERGVGGRLVEIYNDDDYFLIGEVLVWEPGSRLVFDWRAPSFEASQVTEVEVRFVPAPGGTQVTLEHRGWDSLPK